MRILLAALLLLPTAAYAEDQPAVPTNAEITPCHSNSLTPVKGNLRSPGMHPLNQEPAAAVYLPVIRIENGCTRPVKIREAAPTPKPLDQLPARG